MNGLMISATDRDATDRSATGKRERS